MRLSEDVEWVWSKLREYEGMYVSIDLMRWRHGSEIVVKAPGQDRLELRTLAFIYAVLKHEDSMVARIDCGWVEGHLEIVRPVDEWHIAIYLRV
ncbi:MAG: hypothetical protein DRJ96_05800 [Thermoprotei archaeon]|nr:MAG: hypothetical protein DRJ96_05800 [Thermoprotei archaeon]